MRGDMALESIQEPGLGARAPCGEIHRYTLAMQRQRMRIGAQLRDSSVVDTIASPFDGSPVGEICVGSDADIDDAIEAAAAAFEETRRMPAHRRARICEGVAQSLESRAEEFARRMVRESGKPIRYARAEVARAVVTFTLGAQEARSLGGEVLPIDLEARGEGRLCLTTRVPRGPVAAISPFNFPLNLVAHKLSPMIAVGASGVLKPPPQCPLTAHALVEIMVEAGWPAAGASVVHCRESSAQRMVEDPRMAVLSFTGSDVVGWKLKALAGKKQVLLELGGNAPCIVDEHVDLERILPAIVQGAWAHAGQVCIKVQRVLVHRSLFDEFLARFIDATRALAVGDPLDEATVVGPLIEKKHVARVLDWIREAVEGGARLHCGGETRGQIITPAILTNVTPTMRVCKDEVFGPVTVVESFDSFDEAIARSNQTRFGLQAGVFTNDIGRALQAHRELEYGGVIVNDVPTFRVDNFPYGGAKDSGFGREGVHFAAREMTEERVLVLRGPPT
jgi:glyceraldehyde-3-phosphate dehydrogenase (NADP+)